MLQCAVFTLLWNAFEFAALADQIWLIIPGVVWITVIILGWVKLPDGTHRQNQTKKDLTWTICTGLTEWQESVWRMETWWEYWAKDTESLVCFNMLWYQHCFGWRIIIFVFFRLRQLNVTYVSEVEARSRRSGC